MLDDDGGGAALTRTYVERDLRSEYEGRLFYGKDAFEGLRTMDRLGEMKRSGEDTIEAKLRSVFGRVPFHAWMNGGLLRIVPYWMEIR